MITGSSNTRDVARTTVVGGRSPASDTEREIACTGVEQALKRAAGNKQFRARLLSARAAAAQEEGIALEPHEAALLAAVPEEQLASLVRGLVTRYQRPKGSEVATRAPVHD